MFSRWFKVAVPVVAKAALNTNHQDGKLEDQNIGGACLSITSQSDTGGAYLSIKSQSDTGGACLSIMSIKVRKKLCQLQQYIL